MATIPTDRVPDSTLALLREGYRYIGTRCDRYGSDVFQTRLLLRRTICMRGRPASMLFYDTERFERTGAMPVRVQWTLTGRGGVQGLDGAAHEDRKAMLMSLMTPTAVRHLGQLFDDEWRARVAVWEGAGPVVLYRELGRMLTRAVCAWAGVPLADAQVTRRTADLHAMIGSGAAIGPVHWWGRLARRRGERWLAEIVDRVRAGTLPAPAGSALRVIAEHSDPRGRALPRRIAAVELLNLLRPTVAVGRFIVFAALALHDHPAWRERVREDADAAEPFVHEVRRYYPFFPAASARVRRPFEWHGYPFPRGRRVLLDLYGTNHHPALWPEPERFRPERFADRRPDAYALVPQGGGEHTGHRCAGEWITIELMKRAVTNLTSTIRYDVPPQDLAVDLRRLPTLPPSGFVVTNVRRTA
ncbi:cytochrome P450 [Micromonospora costi]|uniref:Cytochrome P450 n=1 Tax=Micromonospora costi TaxID=1530042 RepID=A0A3A9ZP12_9ACTN|nr:cytochrome P450 [Micromonospora costi]RKN49913.1 cytochrome P450 [Micromonospora costi]